MVRTYTLAPHGRLTVLVDGVDPVLAATDVAIDVSSTNGVGVVVERSVYLSSATTTYEAGTGSSASDVGTPWYFGEGAAIGTFDTYLLLFNPNASPPRWTCATCGAGSAGRRELQIAAGNRLSIATDPFQDSTARNSAWW